MSSSLYSTVMFPAVKRSPALSALLGVAMLASPLAPALAQSSTTTPAHQSRAAMRAETVDQRIATLHAELKITPEEESDWKAVAQTMRDNAAAMEKLASEKASQQGMTAVEDLQTYEQFAQAHVDGLKSLSTSFETLYNSMPEQQKKIADQVFQNSRHHEASKPS